MAKEGACGEGVFEGGAFREEVRKVCLGEV